MSPEEDSCLIPLQQRYLPLNCFPEWLANVEITLRLGLTGY